MIEFVINGRFLSRPATGVDRFAHEVVNAIDQLFADDDPQVRDMRARVLVSADQGERGRLRRIESIAAGSRSGQAWEQWDLPRAAGDTLLVNLCNSAPILRKRQLTVIHDAATARVPESYGFAFRAWYGLMIPLSFRRSASVCTVSGFSRKELREVYGPREDLCVLPEGVDHMGRIAPDRGVLERHGLGHRPYLLAVSSLAPHKNFAAVLRAVEMMGVLDFDVVIAGGQNPRVFAAGTGELHAAVKYVGYVSDGELKALYENAACFVFPSLYEGYGLPPTEAMACGCPVIAARAASIPEVCGDACLYFDPRDPATLADVLKRVMGDAVLRGDLSARGLLRASALHWRDAARALLSEIRRVGA